MRDLAGRCSGQRENCLGTCPSRWISKDRGECLGITASDRRDYVGELIACECGSYADDTRAVGFVNWVPVMRLHVGRKKGMTVDFLPRMVTVFVFACLLLQNSRPTFAAFTTGNVLNLLLLIRYVPENKKKTHKGRIANDRRHDC